MKNISIIITFFFVGNLSSFGQSSHSAIYGKISYEQILNFDNNPKSDTFNLFINPEFSVFEQTRVASTESATIKPSSDDELDFSFDIKLNGSKYIVYTNFEEKTIQSQESVFKDREHQTYIVEEKQTDIQWDILNEHKMIGDFDAQKAIGVFRGRTYTVWFTSQIPVKYGPWKLNGLPGLILNVCDETNEVMFIVIDIEIPRISTSSDTRVKFRFNKSIERITLSEYLKMKEEQVDEVNKLFMSKLPRGASVEITNVKANVIELDYEQ